MLGVAAVGVLGMAVATACGSSDTTGPHADSITVSDAWIKASDTEMTAEFGTLTNDSDSDIHLVGGSSEIAGKIEIHETVETDGAMAMREADGGLAIPANGSLTLDPGGDHLMLMDLREPINAGDTVVVTLEFGDGSTKEVSATARDFLGNNEKYQPGHE